MSDVNNLDSPKSHWEGEIITLESKEHFDRLIQEGYEVIEHVVEGNENGTNLTLLMKLNDKQLIANANEIFEHVAKCLYLYDFNKKKIAFTPVQDTDVFWDFGRTITEIIEGDYVKPISSKQINATQKKSFHRYLTEWIKSEKRLKTILGNLSILSNVCIINEINQKISIDIISKEKLSLSQIQDLSNNAKTYDQSVALSFFIFTKHVSKINDNKDDMLIGLIMYDIKNNETLCFNVKSMLSFYNNRNYKQADVLFEVVVDLFKRSIDEDMNCKSYLPLPINSRWYTPLPWILYSVLLPIHLHSNLLSNDSKDITIPQFFTYGMIPNLQQRGNFTYKQFSTRENGRMVCVLIFNNSDKKIPYVLRFDQSKGERLVHLDFAFREFDDESKIIAHHALNFEDVYGFNPDLFLAMTMAGLFDSYFTSIIKNGLKGIKELYEKNPAILSVLNMVWYVEQAINWLNEHVEGYLVLDKLYKEETLTKLELEIVNSMIEKKLGIIVTPKDNEPLGVNIYGFIIRHRHKQGMTNTSLTI